MFKSGRASRLVKASLVSTSFLLVLTMFVSIAHGEDMGDHSLTLSNNLTSQTSEYKIDLTLLDSSSTLGSISFEYCSNSALFGDPCTPPAGFDTSNASLDSQSGATGFTINPGATANQLVVSRTPSVPGSSSLEYVFSNVINPSSNNTYFLRIQTFSSTDATGTYTNRGALAFMINAPANISATVPPYITFCAATTISGYNCSGASGSYVDFGELVTNGTESGSEQLLIATNANNGYNVTYSGHTLTSGNDVIAPLVVSSPSIAGVDQFGLNLAVNTNPPSGSNPSGPGVGGVISNNYNVPNIFRFNPGETLISSPNATDYEKFSVNYIVNRAQNQKPGIYATTITYIALGNF